MVVAELKEKISYAMLYFIFEKKSVTAKSISASIIE